MSTLSIAYSGLSAFQRALNVTGNNIANASTRGYTRQTLNLTSSSTQRLGGFYIGTGVNADSILRNADEFANYQVRSTLSVKSQNDVFYQQASQIDKLLAQDGGGISSSLQSFFQSLGQLNSAPDSTAARNVALKQSQVLVSQFKSLQNRLDEYQNNSTNQIRESVTQINQITAGIANINKQLMSAPGAPDLLDQRDELLRQLSEFSAIHSLAQSDGTVNVELANGNTLVAGTSSREFAVSSDISNTLGTKVMLGTGAGQIDITSRLTSGKLGGLIEYETKVIGQSSQLIGQMAVGLSQTFNAQHKLGLDLNNQIGKDFFTDYNSADQQSKRAISSSQNTGTATLSVSISDLSQIKLSDYELIVSDTGTNQVRLLNKTSGTATTLNWTSSPPAPPAGQLVVDGMTITVNDIGNLVNNDRFTLTPTRGAARDLELQITDSREIALASPVRTAASLSNTGTGAIALGSVINTSAVAKEYRIDFISDTQYNIVNVTDSTSTGPLSFTPNSNNNVQIPDSLNPSYSIVLSGLPKAGDQFNAQYNIGGSGDNRNGLGLASLHEGKVFSNGTESLFDRYANLLSQVGSLTNQAKIGSDTADILHQQALDFQDSKSGVSLDEEGANLLRFKQAYEAAGKLMEVSSQMLNILFEIMR